MRKEDGEYGEAVRPHTAAEHEADHVPKKRHVKKSRKRKLIIAAIVIFIVVGLAVGLGVGLTVGRNNGDDEPSPATTSLPPISRPEAVWQPSVGVSWQIILQKTLALDEGAMSINPDVAVYDIDLFNTNTSVISTLHRLNKKVICYFSAGTIEDWRPDAAKFDKKDIGKSLPEWPGEKWLNLKSQGVRDIMAARIKMAADKGCDAIDPDNVDGYDNDNGLSLTEDDSVDFLNFLTTQASDLKLATGLKNAGGIVEAVLPRIQFAVNEQCVQYKECDSFSPFIEANKPVFHIEYPKEAPSINQNDRDKFCETTGDGDGAKDFSTVLKKMDLGGWVQYCDGKSAESKLYG